MDSAIHDDLELNEIAQLLLTNRNNGDWKSLDAPWGIEQFRGKECPREEANKFFLRCLIDYQCNSNDAWRRGGEYFEKLDAESRHDLWKRIADNSREAWNSEENFQSCKLHRWRRAHNRIWPIANCICMFLDGDVRAAWKTGTTFDVVCRLNYIGAGPEISRMIVGALKDCGQLNGWGDVKADVHVCRVLGRVLNGEKADPVAALRMARELNPVDPWQLDLPLWILGQAKCSENAPKCSDCYLKRRCRYARNRSSEGLC